VQVANPTSVSLPISALYLCIQGVPFEPFPNSLTLAPYEVSRSVALTGIPRGAGKAVARGCLVTCFGVTTENLFRYCTVLYSLVLYCDTWTLYSTQLYTTTLYSPEVVLHNVVMHSTVVYCYATRTTF